MGRKKIYDGVHCRVAGCTKVASKRGWCCAHYTRWRRHGDPLAGNTEVGSPLRYLNEVVRNFSGDNCLFWPFSTNGSGYGHIKIDGIQYLVHRVICEDRHGPPPTDLHEAAHSCGNGHLGCVTKSHLSWKTRAENAADRIVHGTDTRGERNHHAKLTEAQVIEILSERGKYPHRFLAEKYKVTAELIGMIYSRKVWKHVDEPRALYVAKEANSHAD